MRVLVGTIEKDVLLRVMREFGLDNQISIGDNAEAERRSRIKTPYYIEENIIDLKKTLAMCDSIDYGFSCVAKLHISLGEFFDFWELMTEIEKQREFGEPLSNIEYIYRKSVQLGLPVELKRTEEIEFKPEGEYAIVGKSDIGSMTLSQEDDAFLEYCFYVEYTRYGRFTKRPIADNNHWHPRGYNDALADVVAFMRGDREYFKNRRLIGQ